MSLEEIEEAKAILRRMFPRLREITLTSPEDATYNCLGWAAEDVAHWWDHLNYWPAKVPRQWSLAAYCQVYQSLGYEACATPELEAGFTKVAIFVDHNGLPTHAARQLSDGFWTSKLGRMWDITHRLEEVGGAEGYGEVAQI